VLANPAREGTMFRFGLPRTAPIVFTIIDPRGREIRTLGRGQWPGGDHVVRWDGRDEAGNRVPSGLYFYRLRVEDQILSRRLAVTR
jgi:flagellar hook assembly protein FlgD